MVYIIMEHASGGELLDRKSIETFVAFVDAGAQNISSDLEHASNFKGCRLPP